MKLIQFSRTEILAQQKGYRVEGLSIIGPKGKPLKLRLNDTGYPMFSVRGPERRTGTHKIKAHRFAAYLKFGDRIYTDGLEVRHLDGNRTNFLADNLEMGTKSQNVRDIPKEIRSRIASERNRKFDPYLVKAFYLLHGQSRKQTTEHFGMGKGTLHHILKHLTPIPLTPQQAAEILEGGR